MERLGILIPSNGSYFLNPGGYYDPNSGSSRAILLPRVVDPNNHYHSIICKCEYSPEDGKLTTDMEELVVSDCNDIGHEDSRVVRLPYNGGSESFIISCTRVQWDAETGQCRNHDIILFESPDLKTLNLIVPEGIPHMNKNGVMFPQKICDKYWLLHRQHPNICVAWSDDPCLKKWTDIGPIMRPTPNTWQGSHIGAGAPPILIDEGWLLFYHGAIVVYKNGTCSYRKYCLGAALLDYENPTKIIARTMEKLLMEPETEYEIHGWIDNVVFITAAFLYDGMFEIVYGAADSCVARARFSKEEIFSKMEICNKKYSLSLSN